MKTCFFIGHRTVPEAIGERLAAEVEHCISEAGISRFIVGNYGSFDRMAAIAVGNAKRRHPEITLHLLLPYHPAERPIHIPEDFDGTLYPFEVPVPHRLAILKANQHMIDACDYLIAYIAHPGNAQHFLEYARHSSNRNHIKIVNLASMQEQ